MKRFLSTIVTIAIFFSGCAQKTGRDSSSLNRKISDDTESIAIGQPFDDEIYATLDAQPCLDGYEIDEISSMYMSKEYIEEKIYNNRENIYYGYTLQEIEWSFEGDRYVFAPDGEGHTIVKEFEVYEDPFEELFRNVCVGSGVILVCVTLMQSVTTLINDETYELQLEMQELSVEEKTPIRQKFDSLSSKASETAGKVSTNMKETLSDKVVPVAGELGKGIKKGFNVTAKSLGKAGSSIFTKINRKDNKEEQ